MTFQKQPKIQFVQDQYYLGKLPAIANELGPMWNSMLVILGDFLNICFLLPDNWTID